MDDQHNDSVSHQIRPDALLHESSTYRRLCAGITQRTCTVQLNLWTSNPPYQVCRSVIGELATARTRFSVNYSLQEETEKKLHTIDSVGSHPCLPQRAGWQIACQLIWNNLQNPTRPLFYFSLAYLYYTIKWPPPRIVNTLWNVHGIACISEKLELFVEFSLNREIKGNNDPSSWVCP